jgi:hypothetical protein
METASWVVGPISLSQSPLKKNVSILFLLLPPDHNAAVVTKIALVVVALGKIIAESGQHKINLHRPDGEVVVQGDIQTPANYEIECIVARCVRGGASTRVHAEVMEDIVVGIRVGAAKERFHKRLPTLSAVFENRSHVVGEEITAPLNAATCWARTICRRREIKRLSRAGIAIKFTGDPQHVIEINRYATSPAVHGKTVDDVAVLGIEPHVGVIHGDFNLSVVLSKRSGSEQ